MLSDLTDNDLWSAFTQGDKTAFAEMFRRHYSMLFLYGIKVCGDAQVVEDAIQELFTDIWQSRRDTAIYSVRAYLLTALKYKLYKTLRQPAGKDLDEMKQALPFEIDPENFLISREEDRERTERLIEAMKKIPARQREIVYLKIYQNLSYEEIGELMGLNYQVSRNLFSQAIKSLRKVLSLFI